MANVVAPTVELLNEPLDGERITHPSFAQITVHRASVMGGGDSGAVLYGTDFIHRNVITLRIHGSELQRHLSRDWHHANETFVEVEMSEAQWATMVSSLNAGEGVPCTLRHLIGRGEIPELPKPGARLDQAKAEVGETISDALKFLTDLMADVESMGFPKGKTENIKERLRRCKQELEANLPFVVKSFDRHMEGTVEKAKSEVHGYMTAVLMRAGLTQLAAPDKLPLELSGPDESQG